MEPLAQVAAWIGGSLAAIIGIFQFRAQIAQSNRRSFLEQQLKACLEITDIASRLATSTDLTDWKKAKSDFWRLYWGGLVVVEDRNLEARMVEFGEVLSSAQVGEDSLPADQLKGSSLRIAQAARDLISQSWRVNLGTLAGLKEQHVA